MTPRATPRKARTANSTAVVWWLGMQILIPFGIAIFMWYPVAEKLKPVPFSWAKSFAGGDLSLFGALLFFGVLAEAELVNRKSVMLTVYKVIGVAGGIFALLIFAISKSETSNYAFPEPGSGMALSESVSSLSDLNVLIGVVAVVVVTSVVLDIKRRD